MIKVLVRIGGKKKSRTRVHAYNAKNDRSLCSRYIGGPSDLDWEVQEIDVEKFSQVENACWHCEKLLKPKPPKPQRKPSARERRHKDELAKLERWMQATIGKGK